MSEQTAVEYSDGVERALAPGAREAVDGDLTKSAPPEVDEELQAQSLAVDAERKDVYDAEVAELASSAAPKAPAPPQGGSDKSKAPAAQPVNSEEKNSDG